MAVFLCIMGSNDKIRYLVTRAERLGGRVPGRAATVNETFCAAITNRGRVAES